MRNFGRRLFLEATGAGAAGLASTVVVGCGSDDNGGGPGAPLLRLNKWSHFVTRHRPWFEQFANQWGMDNGVTIEINWVDFDGMLAQLSADLDAGVPAYDLYEIHSATAAFEAEVEDLTDVVDRVRAKYSTTGLLPVGDNASLNPETGVRHSFPYAFYAFNGHYRKSLWEGAGLANGPRTWEELLSGGAQILANDSRVIGLGLGESDNDGEYALRSVLWSFGGSIQDENGNVAIDSPETVVAMEYYKSLFEMAMDVAIDDVFIWNAAGNNDSFRQDRASFAWNPISIYRAAQRNEPVIASDTFITPPLAAESGETWTGASVLSYVVPKFAEQKDLAKMFLEAVADELDNEAFNSELYNLPIYPDAAPQSLNEGGWLSSDPFDSTPADKLAVLRNQNPFIASLGYPGKTTIPVAKVFNERILGTMFRSFIRGEKSATEAIADAEAAIGAIFAR